ncbi:hypothetical protein ACL0VS_17795 [Chryseobacterium sp. PMSZPI]|uniref:hypothetical protein n=1 Tax=Chryseobacterium sp. PMSZPI TaxID=1033900 RepID=UPI0039A1AEC1
MKNKLQLLIIALATLLLGLSIWQMLETPTMILPSWFLILLFVPIFLFIAFILGSLLKVLLKSDWNKLTFTSIFVIIISSIFYFSQYKATYKIIIPESYSGEVRLFVSNEKENDFIINNYGIGYINKGTFDSGFHPKVLKGGNNITEQTKNYGKGALATTVRDLHTYDYLSFIVPSKDGNVEGKSVEDLIRIKAIDTTRLYNRPVVSPR